MNRSRRTGPLFCDAIAFVKDVKVVFQDKREKYDEFMKLLRDYGDSRIGVRVVKERVMELFKEHQDLIPRFNIFLPQGQKLSLPLDDDQQQGDGSALKVDAPFKDEALEFLLAVKAAFQDKREKYDQFLKILKDYAAKRIGVRVVKEGMMELFKEHQDFISRFNFFLPPRYKISLPLDGDEKQGDGSALKDDSALADNAKSFVNAVKVAFQDKMEKYNEFLKLLVEYRSANRIDFRVFKEGMMELFKEHQDLLLELNTYLPEGHKISLPLDGDEQQGDGLASKDEKKGDEQ